MASNAERTGPALTYEELLVTLAAIESDPNYLMFNGGVFAVIKDGIGITEYFIEPPDAVGEWRREAIDWTKERPGCLFISPPMPERYIATSDDNGFRVYSVASMRGGIEVDYLPDTKRYLAMIEHGQARTTSEQAETRSSGDAAPEPERQSP